MYIKPMSAYVTEAFVPSDYPSVLFFAKCNDTGAGIYESVSGTIMTTGTEANVTKTGAKITVANTAAAIDYALPSTITLNTTSYYLYIAMIEYATGAIVPSIQLSDGTDSLLIGGSANSVTDGTNTATSTHTGTSVDTLYGGCTRFKAGTTGEGKLTLCSRTAFDGTTNCVSANAAAGDLAAALTVNKLRFYHIIGGSVTCHMAALIKLSAEPSDVFVRSMLSWMTEQVGRGHKNIYPGLKGLV